MSTALGVRISVKQMHTNQFRLGCPAWAEDFDFKCTYTSHEHMTTAHANHSSHPVLAKFYALSHLRVCRLRSLRPSRIRTRRNDSRTHRALLPTRWRRDTTAQRAITTILELTGCSVFVNNLHARKQPVYLRVAQCRRSTVRSGMHLRAHHTQPILFHEFTCHAHW